METFISSDRTKGSALRGGDEMQAKVTLTYACTYSGCKYTGRTSAALNRHEKNHYEERPYSCTKCDRRCTSLSLLKEHKKVHTDSKPFWCLLCEYKCRNKANLKSHLRSHSDERPHACHLCNYKSKTYVNLKNHLRKHTGEKPYFCTVCSYKCSTQGSLNVHLRIHTGEKPYYCTVCDYKSATSGGLKSHYKIHSGEKPYKCVECPKSFSLLGQLKTHKNVHNKDTSYQCSRCNFRSNLPQEINKHIAHHKISALPNVRDNDFIAGQNNSQNYAVLDESSNSSSESNSFHDSIAEQGPNDKKNTESCRNESFSSRLPLSSTEELIPRYSLEFTHRLSGRELLTSVSESKTCFSKPYACIYCDRLFSEIEVLKHHVFSHSNAMKLNEFSKHLNPFSFLDGMFPTNHLQDIHWNELGMPSKFNGVFSMIFGRYL